MKKKIVFTGGHHTSALEVALALKKKGHQVFWLGHKFSMWGDRRPSAEYEEVTGAGLPFFDLKAGRTPRSFHPLKLALIPFGFLQAAYYLAKIGPDLIVSFGGYLALPAVIVGWLFGVPSVTHEQTVTFGLANRIIDRFAKKVLVSWKASLKHFSPGKAVLVGLPIRDSIYQKKTDTFDFKENLPTIYVTGGKQGAHLINQAVKEALPQLLSHYNLIHQCGSTSLHQDFRLMSRVRSRLPQRLRQRYLVKEYFFSDEIGAVFSLADLVVSRAGAHVVAELAALGKPALFIPLPWSYQAEQEKNAQILLEVGLADIFPQEKLSGATLINQIGRIVKNLAKYRQGAFRAKSLVIADARDRVVAEILTLLP